MTWKHLLNHICVTEALNRPQKPPNMALYHCKFSQPYSQFPVWAWAYVRSRLSLVLICWFSCIDGIQICNLIENMIFFLKLSLNSNSKGPKPFWYIFFIFKFTWAKVGPYVCTVLVNTLSIISDQNPVCLVIGNIFLNKIKVWLKKFGLQFYS